MKLEITYEKKRVREHVLPVRRFDYRASALGIMSAWQYSPQSALIDLAERLPHFFTNNESQ